VSGLFGDEDKENVAEDPKAARGKPGETKKSNVAPSAPEGEDAVFLPPHVGRLKVHKDALHFEADMFGLDLTSLKLMRWQIKRAACAPARYAVTVVDWHGVSHDFQLHKQAAELHEKMVREWRLEPVVDDDDDANARSSTKRRLRDQPSVPGPARPYKQDRSRGARGARAAQGEAFSAKKQSPRQSGFVRVSVRARRRSFLSRGVADVLGDATFFVPASAAAAARVTHARRPNANGS
jgi:hypothetical protein